MKMMTEMMIMMTEANEYNDGTENDQDNDSYTAAGACHGADPHQSAASLFLRFLVFSTSFQFSLPVPFSEYGVWFPVLVSGFWNSLNIWPAGQIEHRLGTRVKFKTSWKSLRNCGVPSKAHAAPKSLV